MYQCLSSPLIHEWLGSWLEGTCDINSSTAQIAADSLASAFPGEKLKSALKFCEKGIVKVGCVSNRSNRSSLSLLIIVIQLKMFSVTY